MITATGKKRQKGYNMEAILRINNLEKSFGRRKVIDDVSFEVMPGEVFGFLGPNGAGKTTTLKMIMGFLSVDNGEIWINGYNLKKQYEQAMSCLGGIVENPELYKDLSGRTNLSMYARLHQGVSRERVNEVAAMVGMTSRLDEKLKKYSLGMKQRIGLAQALLHRPRLLILDEPTNGLDPAGIRELRDILKRLAHEEGVGVVVSSHLLAEMQLMCDRVGIIHLGRLLGVRSIRELTEMGGHAARYRLLTGQVKEAVAILQTAYESEIAGHADGSIDLEIEYEKIPAVIRLLAMKGIDLYGVSRIESSLEDAFLQVTGGGISIE